MLKTHLKLAFKVLLRRKFFTAISLFGITFTLVVLMVVAALMDHLVAPMAPETRLDRTLFITYVVLQGEQMRTSGAPGYGLLERCARGLPGVEKESFFGEAASVVAYHDGEKMFLSMRRTDGAYWELLDFNFVEGGPLTDQDDRDAEPVAVVTESTRRRFFGEGAAAVGQPIEVDGQRFRVKGVVRDVGYFRRSAYADLWIPNSITRDEQWKSRMRGGFNAMLYVPNSADRPRIESEYEARLARLELPNPEQYKTTRGRIVTRFGEIAQETLGTLPDKKAPVARAAAILLVSALLFMMLPAINLINLNMSRIFERASEIGVRKSFGASSGHLVGQFLLENLVLSFVGGVLSLGLAALVLRGLNASGLLPGATLILNLRIFGYAFVLCVFFGILSGVYPSWRMSRLDPVAALRGGNA